MLEHNGFFYSSGSKAAQPEIKSNAHEVESLTQQAITSVSVEGVSIEMKAMPSISVKSGAFFSTLKKEQTAVNHIDQSVDDNGSPAVVVEAENNSHNTEKTESSEFLLFCG